MDLMKFIQVHGFLGKSINNHHKYSKILKGIKNLDIFVVVRNPTPKFYYNGSV